MRRRLVLAIAIILVGGAPGTVSAQSAIPDPAKWNNSGLIRIFEQNGGALLSGIYRRGGFDNGASTFSTFNDLALRNPNSVQSMEATVTLLDASAVGLTTFPSARLDGFFYWNGTGSGTSTAPCTLGEISKSCGRMESRSRL